MAVEAVRCPHCQGEAVVKYGTASNGKAWYRCQQADQCGRTFMRAYAYLGCVPEVKRQMVEMTLSAYPNNPEARNAIRAQAKWRKAR